MKIHSKMYNEGKYRHDKCNIIIKRDMKNLDDALSYFGLFLRFQELEKSLVEVRCCKNTKEEHEHLWKAIDKEMQKLSLTYHPDKVKRKGGSEEEVTEAQKIQSILNTSRTVLKILTAAFLEDIDIDHQYAFYTGLSLSFLGNENEIKDRICEIRSRIVVISEIKQRYVISEIRSFLVCSRCSIAAYFEKNVEDFEKYRDLALFHLKCCAEGYEKLCLGIEEVEEECKYDKHDNVGSVLHKMGSNCKRVLALLKELHKIDEKSLENCSFFSFDEPIDLYFVLPFVSYINVFLMCKVMIKQKSFLGRCGSYNQLIAKHNNELLFLMRPYYLVSCYCGNRHREIALQIIEEKGIAVATDEDSIRADAISEAFNFILKEVGNKMEGMFKVDNYAKRNRDKNEVKSKVDDSDEGGSESPPKDDIKECMTMIHEFGKMNETSTQNIDKLKMKREDTKEKLEECDTILQQIKEKNKKVTEINMKLNMNSDETGCF